MFTEQLKTPASILFFLAFVGNKNPKLMRINRENIGDLNPNSIISFREKLIPELYFHRDVEILNARSL